MVKSTKSPLTKIIVLVLVLAGAGTFYYQNTNSSGGSDRVVFAVQRGDLQVTVLEGGNVEAQESQEIKSQIKGRNGAKILSIIEEGYLVTQEDIDNGLVLVELDPSELEDQMVNQEISTQTAEATYIQRKAQYEIQLNQNQRNISEAELAVKFARMDFEKFMGAESVHEIATMLDLKNRFADKPAPVAEPKPKPKPSVVGGSQRRQRPANTGKPSDSSVSNNARGSGGGGGKRGFDPARLKQMIDDNGGEIPSFLKDRLGDMGLTEEEFLARVNGGDAGGHAQHSDASAKDSPPPVNIAVTLDTEYLHLRNSLDFAKYADPTTLEDGQAKQQLITFDAEVLVAQEESRLAETRAEGQRRLFEQDFITENELELQEVQKQKAEIRVNTSRMEKELYITYTFPKQAERLFFDYEEALMGLVRVRKEGEAKMAQENAQLKSAERKYRLATEEFEDVKEQIEKCVILAERPGLVVYGSSSSSSPWRRSTEEPIAEGATVRERQRIITIPDTTHMGVKVNIHESAVKKIAIDQYVSIEIDAYPGRRLDGKITKVAVLADSANAFMNPDLKIYPTEILIDGVHDWLRPGMSAEVEILIEELNDVLYIPIQSVTYEGDDRICYVLENGSPVKRIVELGSFTEEFIEIKSGLTEGEEVLLLAPVLDTDDSKLKTSPAKQETKDAV